MKTPSVLFVCTGNICRSPTAEGILRHRAAQLGVELVIDSAGTHGYHIGDAPDPRSIKAAAGRGYDISNLKARRVSSEDYERFDYVVALDEGHYAILQRACPPHLQHKVVRMMQFAPEKGYDEVPDPYYGGHKDFELVLDLLESAISGLLNEIGAAAVSGKYGEPGEQSETAAE